MKDIRIDFTQSEPCLDSKQLGEYGEKGVERFAITPPAEMSENPEIRFYVVAFSTARGPVRLNPFEKTEVIYVPVEEACIGGVPLALQLEGHNDSGTLVIKTPVVEGFSFAKSVPEGSIRFLGGVQNRGHVHSNIEVLHKLGEENGNLVFNGKEIGAKTYKTVELSTQNGDSITYCDYSYAGSVFFFAKSIPIGAEIIKVEIKINNEIFGDNWIDICNGYSYEDYYVPFIVHMNRAFHLEAYDDTCIAIKYYFNDLFDSIHTAALQNDIIAMRITYAEESGEE